jgi:hypothetical protein
MVPSSRPKSNLKVPAPRSDFSNVQIHSVHFMILHDDSVSVLLRSPNSAAKARVLFPGSKTKGTLHRLRKKRILLSPEFMGIVCWLAAANFPRHRYLHTPSPNPDRATPPAYPGAFIPPLYHTHSPKPRCSYAHNAKEPSTPSDQKCSDA